MLKSHILGSDVSSCKNHAFAPLAFVSHLILTAETHSHLNY